MEKINSYLVRKIKKLAQNHAEFGRAECKCSGECSGECIYVRRARGLEAKRIGCPLSQTLMSFKDGNSKWFSLNPTSYHPSIPDTTNTIPDTIRKYFNSDKWDDYRPAGCASMEIYLFPKSRFKTYSEIVRYFEQEYFIYPTTSSYEHRKILEYNIFELEPYNTCEVSDTSDTSEAPEASEASEELITDVSGFYSSVCTNFCGFNDAIDSTTKENLFDFLPDKIGYKGKPQLKLCAIFTANGNQHESLCETDAYFIYLYSSTG